VLSGADYVMLTIFVVEIVLKWYNGFWLFWQVEFQRPTQCARTPCVHLPE